MSATLISQTQALDECHHESKSKPCSFAAGIRSRSFELVHRLGDCFFRQAAVDAPQGGQERGLVQRGVIVLVHVGAIYVIVAQPLLEQQEDGVFVVGFGVVVGHHLFLHHKCNCFFLMWICSVSHSSP